MVEQVNNNLLSNQQVLFNELGNINIAEPRARAVRRVGVAIPTLLDLITDETERTAMKQAYDLYQSTDKRILDLIAGKSLTEKAALPYIYRNEYEKMQLVKKIKAHPNLRAAVKYKIKNCADFKKIVLEKSCTAADRVLVSVSDPKKFGEVIPALSEGCRADMQGLVDARICTKKSGFGYTQPKKKAKKVAKKKTVKKKVSKGASAVGRKKKKQYKKAAKKYKKIKKTVRRKIKKKAAKGKGQYVRLMRRTSIPVIINSGAIPKNRKK